MSDMLEKIVVHLLKEQRGGSSTSITEDQGTYDVKKDKSTSTSSLHSGSSRSSTPKLFNSGMSFGIKKTVIVVLILEINEVSLNQFQFGTE